MTRDSGSRWGARTRRTLVLLWTALFLCSLALQPVQLAAPAPALAAHDEGIFELDGNADRLRQRRARTGRTGPRVRSICSSSDGDSEAPINDNTYFTGGGSKD